MEIVYASDENYFPYIYVGILTLLETNANRDIHINYIYQNVEKSKLKALADLGAKYGHSINSFELVMPEVFKSFPSYKGTGSKTTYAKFLFASMFPYEEKVLFLDPDTIVLNSIQPLIDYDLEDDLIAGVIECLPSYHKRASKMSTHDPYINGGVVMCNLKKWRETNFEEQSLTRLSGPTISLNFDQGILNELCAGNIKILDPCFNVLAEVFAFKSADKISRRYKLENYYCQDKIDIACENPVIIHFTEFLYNKPLSKYCTHPYAEFFWRKLKTSPIKFELLDIKLDTKHRIRKWAFDNLKFEWYMAFENILDFRRIFYIRHPRIKKLYVKIKQKGKQ